MAGQISSCSAKRYGPTPMSNAVPTPAQWVKPAVQCKRPSSWIQFWITRFILKSIPRLCPSDWQHVPANRRDTAGAGCGQLRSGFAKSARDVSRQSRPATRTGVRALPTGGLKVALVFLYTTRGIPCLYYGTEQAFDGAKDPWDREDMFAGQFERGPSLGDNFNLTHPLYQFVARLNNFRRLYPALQTGVQSNLWSNASGPGLFAYTRRLETQEVLVVFNTASNGADIASLSDDLPERNETAKSSRRKG